MNLLEHKPFYAISYNAKCVCPFASKFSYSRCIYISLMSTSINRMILHHNYTLILFVVWNAKIFSVLLLFPLNIFQIEHSTHVFDCIVIYLCVNESIILLILIFFYRKNAQKQLVHTSKLKWTIYRYSFKWKMLSSWSECSWISSFDVGWYRWER